MQANAELVIQDLMNQNSRLSEERAIFSALSTQLQQENVQLKEENEKLKKENDLLSNKTEPSPKK